MTIHAKQPGKLSVVNKTVKVHLGNSPENHRKYHCSYSDMLEWRLCVKSDWLSVVKSCCLCLLLAWIGWLHWSNHQLSVDVLELKNAFSFESRIGEYPLEKESSFLQVENMQQPDFISNDLGVKEITFRNRFVDLHFHAAVLWAKGTIEMGQQNFAASYGYKTVLVKENHEDVLMLSEITQDNRGICYRHTENSQHCATDSISHLVMRYFEREDKIAIKPYTNYYNVNYYLTEKNSYIGIVALDLWNS